MIYLFANKDVMYGVSKETHAHTYTGYMGPFYIHKRGMSLL